MATLSHYKETFMLTIYNLLAAVLSVSALQRLALCQDAPQAKTPICMIMSNKLIKLAKCGYIKMIMMAYLSGTCSEPASGTGNPVNTSWFMSTDAATGDPSRTILQLKGKEGAPKP